MSNTVGPVCHIPPTSTVANPSVKNVPGVAAPAQATLQSLQSTVNNLREIIIYLTGQQGPAGKAAPKSKPARWTENQPARITATTRIFQNNDKTSPNFVDVETINGITMKDGVTGESWNWKR